MIFLIVRESSTTSIFIGFSSISFHRKATAWSRHFIDALALPV